MMRSRGVAQLVAHAVWDREVAGSSPVAPTIIVRLDDFLYCVNHDFVVFVMEFSIVGVFAIIINDRPNTTRDKTMRNQQNFCVGWKFFF